MRSLIRPIALAAALVLVLAACGDDDTGSDDTAAPSGTTGSTEAPAATTAPAADPTPGVGATGDLQELLDRYETATIRTTYRFGEEEDAEVIILAQDPNASPPVEAIILPEEGSKIVITDGTTVFCDSSSATCFEVPGGGGESLTTGLLGPFAAFLAVAPVAGETDTEPITVAGRSGVCFTFTPPAGADADTDFIRQCIDGEFGFSLLLQGSETGSDEVETFLELTEFSTPTADDFSLPFPLATTP